MEGTTALPTKLYIQGGLLIAQVLLNYTDTFNREQKEQLQATMGAIQMFLLFEGYLGEVKGKSVAKGQEGLAGLTRANSRSEYWRIGGIRQ
jgi:hypothetical protein